MKAPSHLGGFNRAARSAGDRKLNDAYLIHRVMNAGRKQLAAECDRLAITHAGKTDDELRRALISWHRQAGSTPW